MYIKIDRDDIWKQYTKESAPNGLYRGGGNEASAKMYKTEDGKTTVRPADFNIRFDKDVGDEGEYMAYPDVTKGLSFSNSLQRLKDIPIKGKVWLLPRDKELPEGLMINYNTIDHPLINVSEKMPVTALVTKLKELEQQMQYTGVKIS